MTRADKLREKIAPFADAIVLTEPLSQYYICGFRYTDGYVLVTAKSAHLITDFRYVEAAQKLAPEGFEIVTPARGDGMVKYMREVLEREGAKTVAFEEDRITYAEHEKLANALGVTLVPSRGAVETMRRIKDKGEVDKMRAAQKITDDAFTHILGVITPEMTEIEVATELEYFMRKHGAEDKSFDTICVSGSASSLPHGVPRNVKLERGFLTMDFGCIIDGYHSDMTRTVCLGKADDEMKRLYATVLKAQLAAMEGAKVGMKCAAIDAIARDIIEDAGYHGAFGHSLGHSVGLEIHEAPNFAPRSSDFFENGHVMTVEPGIYLAGKYGCRIEDMIYAEDGKVISLTASDKQLIELF